MGSRATDTIVASAMLMNAPTASAINSQLLRDPTAIRRGGTVSTGVTGGGMAAMACSADRDVAIGARSAAGYADPMA